VTGFSHVGKHLHEIGDGPLRRSKVRQLNHVRGATSSARTTVIWTFPRTRGQTRWRGEYLGSSFNSWGAQAARASAGGRFPSCYASLTFGKRKKRRVNKARARLRVKKNAEGVLVHSKRLFGSCWFHVEHPTSSWQTFPRPASSCGQLLGHFSSAADGIRRQLNQTNFAYFNCTLNDDDDARSDEIMVTKTSC